MVTFRDISTSQPRLRLDRTFYDKVRSDRSHYKLVDKFIIPPNNGRGFIVSRGQTFRVIQAEGPQVGDVTFWNAHNPKEFFKCTNNILKIANNKASAPKCLRVIGNSTCITSQGILQEKQAFRNRFSTLMGGEVGTFAPLSPV